MFRLFRDRQPTLMERQLDEMSQGIEPDYRFLFAFRLFDMDIDRGFPRLPMKRVSDWLDQNTVGLWKYVYTHATDPRGTKDLWGVAFTSGEDATAYSNTFDVAVTHPSVAMTNFDPRVLSAAEAEPHLEALAKRPAQATRLNLVSLPPAAAKLRAGETAAVRLRGLPHLRRMGPPITPASLTIGLEGTP